LKAKIHFRNKIQIKIMCYESHMALKIKDSSLKKTWVHMDFNQVNRR